MDPFDLRLANCYREGSTTPTGQTPDALSLPEMFAKLRPLYEDAKKRVEAESTDKIKKGGGIALGVYGSCLDGPDSSEAWVKLNPDGSITVGASWEDHGQGADSGMQCTASEALEKLCSELREGRDVALATIVQQDGSAPRGPGSHLLASQEGLIYGTFGGGRMEAEIIKACAVSCRNRRPAVHEFRLDGKAAADSDMICGNMRILVEPFFPNKSNYIEPPFNVAPEHASAGLALQAAKTGGLLVRPFPPDKTAWSVLFADGSLAGAGLPAEVETALRASHSAESALVLVNGKGYFCEPCRKPERMIIIGVSHVAKAIAMLGALTGFETHIVDDRPDFASPSRFPESMLHIEPEYKQCLSALGICPTDYIVIVTRGHLFDREALEEALTTNAGYIGMIGSKSKRDQIYKLLLENGFSRSELARVHSPICISIGAETPEERAVSIVAECIAHRRKESC